MVYYVIVELCIIEILCKKNAKDDYNYRCVVYICMTPRSLANPNIQKKKHFENLRKTSHWPHKPKLFPKNPQTYGKKILNITDIDINTVKEYITETGLKLI